MTPHKLAQFIDDPRGPERLLIALTAAELATLIDALYRNLDKTSPELGAEELYELAVEEADRRSAPTPALQRKG